MANARKRRHVWHAAIGLALLVLAACANQSQQQSINVPAAGHVTPGQSGAWNDATVEHAVAFMREHPVKLDGKSRAIVLRVNVADSRHWVAAVVYANRHVVAWRNEEGDDAAVLATIIDPGDYVLAEPGQGSLPGGIWAADVRIIRKGAVVIP